MMESWQEASDATGRWRQSLGLRLITSPLLVPAMPPAAEVHSLRVVVAWSLGALTGTSKTV